MGDALLRGLKTTIRRHRLIPKNALLIVGVSGGADSLALLHLLSRLALDEDFRLHVATLDHGLRGDAGHADALYVEEIAATWKLPCTRAAVSVTTLAAQWKIGIEAAARRARYDFLARVVMEQAGTAAAVAHHADDQAETVLMRLIRGTGLRGLGGMSYSAPMPYHPEVTLIRPLLDFSRAEIDSYCEEFGIVPRHDVTNADTNLLRNRVRHQVLPALKDLNPQITRSLTAVAANSRDDEAYLQSQLQAEFPQLFTPDRGTTTIQLELRHFRALHPALARRALRAAVEQLLPEGVGQVDYAHLDAALSLALNGDTGAVAVFGDGVRMRLEYTHLAVEAGEPPIRNPVFMPSNLEIPLPVPGSVTLNHGVILSAVLTPEAGAVTLSIPEGARVSVRTRRIGDRFQPAGMGGRHQTIKAYMVNAKIPASERDLIPLLLINGVIAAVLCHPRWRLSEAFLPQEGSKMIYFRLEQDHS